MGNTSQKGRHISGEDSGPSLTADRYIEQGSYESETINDFPQPRHQRRARAATTLSATDTRERETKVLPTVFKWEAGGKEVYVSGSFNNWKSKIPLAKSHGDFYTIVDLPEGEHQYKFYVDGSWMHNTNEKTQKSGLSDDPLSCQAHPRDYAQDIPVRPTSGKQSGPPFLPPHLLQVILNKDTPAHCEPTLLPEPNHVMLNHLYALSIKDGVMVLSATHRFRKKYVTTLLYKPI